MNEEFWFSFAKIDSVHQLRIENKINETSETEKHEKKKLLQI